MASKAALALWAEAIIGYEVSLPDHDPAFAVRSRSWTLAPLVISRASFGPARIARTEQQIRCDSFQHYSLMLPVEGAWEAESDGRRFASTPGVVTTFDNARAWATTTTRLDTIVVRLPRAALDAALGGADLHGLQLDHPAGRLLSAHLATLADHLHALSADEAPFVAEATVAMIVAYIRAGLRPGARVRRTDMARRAIRLIDADLGGKLTPESLRAELNVSRATLFRVFAPFGGVESFVRERRLSRIHALVAAGHSVPVKQLAARYGFTSPAHLSRAFSARFGYSLSELATRTQMLPATRPTSATTAIFRDWIERMQ